MCTLAACIKMSGNAAKLIYAGYPAILNAWGLC
jgi:hypothetical protein